MKNRWKKVLPFCIGCGTLLALGLCAGGCQGKEEAEYIRQEADTVWMDNGVIRVELDADTGYVRTVQNLITGTVHKEEGEDAFPFILD